MKIKSTLILFIIILIYFGCQTAAPYHQPVESTSYLDVDSTNYLGTDGEKYTKLAIVYGATQSDILRSRYEQLFANKLDNKNMVAVSSLDIGFSSLDKESIIKLKKSLIEIGIEGILLIEVETLTGDWIYQISLFDLKKGLIWKATTKIDMGYIDYNFDNAMKIVSDSVINKMEKDGIINTR